MAPKGTQVVTGSSTKLPGSSAPTERRAHPGHPPASAGGTAGRGRAKEAETHRGKAALCGCAVPATALQTPRSNWVEGPAPQAISRTNKEQIPEREHVRVKGLRRQCHILNTTGWYSDLLPKPLRW
jgi:hypothetical protein